MTQKPVFKEIDYEKAGPSNAYFIKKGGVLIEYSQTEFSLKKWK